MSDPKQRSLEVYHIAVPREKLRAMPSDERAFLLLLGSSANQVSMLQKLLMFSMHNQPTTELERTLCAAQTQMILRLTIGTVHESWLLIKNRFVRSRLGKEYTPLLDPDGNAALGKLKKLDGSSNLISSIRNTYSFHFPEDTAAIDTAFDEACNDPNSDDLWNLYFSKYGFNSFFLVSDLIVLHGITQLTKEAGPAPGQERIMDEALECIVNIFEFTKSYFAASWLKHFGQSFDANESVKISNPPLATNISIPFFIDLDG